jgi:4-amino-4-deoxy-L-arabinose transferase-like glycosyltransferase
MRCKRAAPRQSTWKRDNRMPPLAHTDLQNKRISADASRRDTPIGFRGAGSDHAIAAIVFLVCLAYLCMFLRYTSLEPDEGIVLLGAERILDGELPYRDFFSFYTPGSFYLAAWLFRIFGDSFLVARGSIAVAGAICSVITYVLARRVCSRGVSLLCALLATTTGAAFRFLVLHNPYSTLLCCLSLYSATRYLESRASIWALLTGSFASFTVLFEQSKGAGLCAGLVLGFLISAGVGHASTPRKSCAWLLALGLVWPLVLAAVYFAVHHSLKVMLQSWLWPLQHYAHANRVPYGFQNWSDAARQVIFHTGPLWLRIVKILTISPGLIVAALPIIGFGLLIYWTRRMRRSQELSAEMGYYVLVCSVSTGLLGSVVVTRADVLHFMYLAPVWYVELAWVLGSLGRRSRLLISSRPYLTAYVGIAFGLLALAVLLNATGARNRIATRRGAITTGESDTVINYLQSNLAPGQQLLVYPYLPLYNYLTMTRSPSRHLYFQPGMNTPEQGQEIVISLASQRSRAVLFEPWFAEKIPNSWPETHLGAIARDSIADYIVRNYQVCKMLNSPEGWRFHYMVRKGQACP